MQQPHDEPQGNELVDHAADTEHDTDTKPDQPAATTTPKPTGLSRSRVGGAWIGLVLGAVVLVLLLVFVLQNGQAARISFLVAEGELPLGVALLLAAVAGALIIAVPGSVRIVQLRRAARRMIDQHAGNTEPDPS